MERTCLKIGARGCSVCVTSVLYTHVHVVCAHAGVIRVSHLHVIHVCAGSMCAGVLHVYTSVSTRLHVLLKPGLENFEHYFTSM